MVILAIACILGYVSHFVMKFPEDCKEVGACVVLYGILMTFNYYVETYIEMGAFFMSSTHELKCVLKNYQRIKFISKCEPTADLKECFYEVELIAEGKDGKSVTANKSFDVAEYFDNKGYCHFLPVEDKIIEGSLQELR